MTTAHAEQKDSKTIAKFVTEGSCSFLYIPEVLHTESREAMLDGNQILKVLNVTSNKKSVLAIMVLCVGRTRWIREAFCHSKFGLTVITRKDMSTGKPKSL